MNASLDTLLQRLRAGGRKALDFMRAWPLAVVGGLMLWLIATPNPLLGNADSAANHAKLGIFAWLICKEAGLAYLGYWVDRLLHPNSRPSQFRSHQPSDSMGTTALDVARMAAEKRRAFIVAAAMLAGGLIQ